MSAVLVVVAAALCAGGAAPAATGGAGAELRVSGVSGDSPEVDLSLDLPGGAQQPGRVVLYEPVGFNVYAVRPAGSDVGRAFVTAANSAYGTPTYSTLAGDVIAEDPPTQSMCGAESPIGLWQLELSLLGQPFEIPLLLDRRSMDDPVADAGSIVLCVPGIAPGGAPVPIRSLDFSLDGVPPPSRQGAYLWRAVVTPLASDQQTLEPQAAYELRATVPVPHRLTLSGARGSASRVISLRGRLTGAGRPRAGVPVRLVRLSRAVTAGGRRVEDAILGWTTTGRDGSYAFRTRATGTQTFLAVAESTSRPCHGPSIAPAGCVASTFPAAESDPLTVR